MIQETTTQTSQPGSVVSRIRPIGFGSEGIKILLYGRSGTGKTTLWGTFPGPILAVICSGGANSGELRSLDTPEYRKKVSQVTLSKAEELMDLVQHVKETNSFQTIVLDHATGFADMVLSEILGFDSIVQKTWGMANREHYGQSSIQCKDYWTKLLDLKTNVVIIAQERAFKTKEDVGSDSELITPKVAAGVQESLADWLNIHVDYVCQTAIRLKLEEGQPVTSGEIEYILRTKSHPIYSAKFRKPKGGEMPEHIIDPSYTKIMKLIRGESVE